MSPDSRRAAHAALAAVTDSVADPDRIAWHRAQAATGSDEDVAAGLERSAELARSRGGEPSRAADALERLTVSTRPSGTPCGRGIEARCRALLSEGEAAEGLYRAAIRELRGAPAGAELARAHLPFGEWLRRERRRGEARDQLRSAHGMLEMMGMEALAERARRELLATTQHARARSPVVPRSRDGGVPAGETLTAQEAQIALLAQDGLSNREIATRLFISPRTVQYHLSHVFTKLGIRSRHELHHVLAAATDRVTPRGRLT